MTDHKWKEHELASRRANAAAFTSEHPEGLVETQTVDDVFQPSATQRDIAKQQFDSVETASKPAD